MFAVSPANAASGFVMLLSGGFRRLGDVFYFATPMIDYRSCCRTAVKMGLFNIGASDQ